MKIFVALLALSSAARKDAAKTESTKMFKTSAANIRNKGIDILFNDVDVDKNMVISPLSIMGCMYMLAAGSAGESREEILSALGFGNIFDENSGITVDKPFKAYQEMVNSLVSQGDNGYTLDIANGMFHQTGMSDFTSNELDPQYMDILKENFIRDVSNIEEVDFANKNVETTNHINKWIKRQTKNKIPKLFKEPLDSDTLVVLASTLYFKASWNQKFNVLTKQQQDREGLCFATTTEALLASQCEDVTWMTKEENVVFMQFGGNMKAKVFEIPLKNAKSGTGDVTNKYTMQIWLPHQMITNPEEDAQFRKFIKSNIGSVRRKMGGKQKSTIIMPKFSIEYSENIVESLQKIGINKVFDPNEADLSPMLGDNADAFVSKVTHGVKFDLDEDGVEGAAVTAAEISSRTFTQPLRIEVNRPFYFVVSNRCWAADKSGTGKSCAYGNVPLFVGRVVNPL